LIFKNNFLLPVPASSLAGQIPQVLRRSGLAREEAGTGNRDTNLQKQQSPHKAGSV
jgi:hypothetical protein